jgi:hypothetical protein
MMSQVLQYDFSSVGSGQPTPVLHRAFPFWKGSAEGVTQIS